jgi:hypothetical protein
MLCLNQFLVRRSGWECKREPNTTSAACRAGLVVGLYGVKDAEYVYCITQLDLSSGNAPAYKVLINIDDLSGGKGQNSND